MQSVDSGSGKRPFSVQVNNSPGVGSYVAEVKGSFVVVMMSVVEIVKSVESTVVDGVVSVEIEVVVDDIIVEGFSVGLIVVVSTVGHS